MLLHVPTYIPAISRDRLKVRVSVREPPSPEEVTMRPFFTWVGLARALAGSSLYLLLRSPLPSFSTLHHHRRRAAAAIYDALSRAGAKVFIDKTGSRNVSSSFLRSKLQTQRFNVSSNWHRVLFRKLGNKSSKSRYNKCDEFYTYLFCPVIYK